MVTLGKYGSKESKIAYREVLKRLETPAKKTAPDTSAHRHRRSPDGETVAPEARRRVLGRDRWNGDGRAGREYGDVQPEAVGEGSVDVGIAEKNR